MRIRQTKDSELKFARGGARHRAGLRSAGSAEAVLSGPHKILCLYHNAFPRYYQLVPVEAVSHQKSPLKTKFPGFCPSREKPSALPTLSRRCRCRPAHGGRAAPATGAARRARRRGLYADGHVVYPAGSGRRWAAESEHGGFARVVPRLI